MGRRHKRGRAVNGILLLDKPIGETSNRSLQRAKRLFDAAKAGHTGSLDPLASGLLPLCFGEATKVSAFLLDADKAYRCEAKLGVVTNTGDADGEVIRTREVPKLDRQQVETLLQSFVGEQDQVPPMFSAIKQNGKALYELAREGIEVERKPRTITIYSLELLEFAEDRLVFDVHCSKGTYVRTLVEDLGEKMGCGAHVTALRRTRVAQFRLDDTLTLDDLALIRDQLGVEGLDAKLVPMEEALTEWPQITLSDDAAFYLRQGQPVLVPKAPTEGMVRLFESSGTFIGMGLVLDDGRIAPKRLLTQA
ncbi:MAG: tRNA pseudouridine(55) synthase TruB [Gammaproteobacteria bacterium]|nr:tRNA pseudouridine(55) synthase TruB [Gammaproteobacteria bacterium]